MAAEFSRETTSEAAASFFADEIKGKTVLVTGASWEGLGAEAARVIVKNGAALVILAGRRQESLDETTQKIKAESPNANLRSLILDLSSLESVRQAAQEVNQYPETIDVLINNAAVMASPYSTTKDGFELQFGTNHLGHFLFTGLIFSRIMASKEPRIVNVSSFGHHFCPILYDDPGFSEGAVYDKWNAYGQAKTANILFSRELANRYGDKGLASFSLHPGVIITPLAKHINVEDEFKSERVDYYGNKVPMPADLTVFKTIQQGTSTHIVAAFDPSIKTQNGSYLQDARIDNDSVRDWAKDDQNASRLWELSEKLVAYTF
jgi:NAD(P)-dependent dehydrogenase (short-subunit alcohol dehydrogenase family)